MAAERLQGSIAALHVGMHAHMHGKGGTAEHHGRVPCRKGTASLSRANVFFWPSAFGSVGARARLRMQRSAARQCALWQARGLQMADERVLVGEINHTEILRNMEADSIYSAV